MKYETALHLHDSEVLRDCPIRELAAMRYKLRYSYLVRKKMLDFCERYHNGYSTKELARTTLLHESVIFAVKSHQNVEKLPFICLAQISACIDAVYNKEYFDYKWLLIRPGDEHSPWE